jgi:Stage II sporulation protein E (SpoIIE)
VAPFHPLRHSARAVLARSGAAIAIFTAIAVLVLAGGSGGPLTDAAAHKGEPAAGSVVSGQPETGEVPPQETSPPEDVAPPEGPATPEELYPPEEPATPEELYPPAEPTTPAETAPAPDSREPAAAPEEDAGGEDDAWDEGDAGGEDDGRGEEDAGKNWDEDRGDGKNWDEDRGDDRDWSGDYPGEGDGDDPEGERPDRSGAERSWRWPAGGAKGSDPEGEWGDEEDEPAPAGRPQVAQPAPTAGPSNDPSGNPSGDGEPNGSVGTGQGELTDRGGSGEPGSSAGRLTATLADSGAAGGSGGDSTGAGTGDDTFATALVSSADSSSADSSGAGAEGSGNASGDGDEAGNDAGPVRTVTKEVEKLVGYVPDGIKAALAALAALSILLGVGYLLAAVRAKRLGKQRRELLQEVGLLQTALLPPVPDKVGALLTSVAYRPADGPGAGGDFYDVLPLPGGRVGFILGDVSGHGRGALARTAFMRYTLRAYLEAGLEPRVALQVAGRVIDDNLGGDFATVLLAVHDPETGSLTYASAGHPAPIVVGPQPHHPVTAGSSPPIGVGVRTGLRQTTVPLVPGSVACLFTDGLMEARTEEGILGRERLAELLEELGDDATARGLIESVASEATKTSDDMAAVIVSPTAGVTAGLFRTEQLELSARELEGPIARRFLEAAGLPPHEVEDAEHDARLLAERFGGVVLHVVFGNRLRVEVLPRNVESIEAASRRVSAGTAR